MPTTRGRLDRLETIWRRLVPARRRRYDIGLLGEDELAAYLALERRVDRVGIDNLTDDEVARGVALVNKMRIE
jgi:hypothetical protein